MKKSILGLFALGITFTAFATEPHDFSRFENITQIPVSGIVTPKVVKFKTNDYYNGNTILLDENQEIIPHKWIRKSQKIKSQNITVASVSSKFDIIMNKFII